MYQKVIIVGNLGRDPEMRFLPSGTPVTTLSVATNESWTDRDGNRQKRTTWWRVSVFGKQAETVNQYLSKGRQVMIEGTMQADAETGGPRMWTGNDGQARASFEMRADRVQFLGGRDGDNGGSYGTSEDSGDYDGGPMNEDDIPF